MASAVVFAYHDVGVRCLHALLAHAIDVRLVVTHRDDPRETIWFDSVAQLARAARIPSIMPTDAKSSELRAQLAGIAPDGIFSFYYRHMLPVDLLATARRGAYNMHGSLLPKYRGRVPINWALIHGEHETGATLHEMVAKPDAGGIVDQEAVTILPNDRAVDVFRKVTLAAEVTLLRALPGLIAGTARPYPQALAAGSYFGGRKPEDGRIDWSRGAWSVHNLIRAVAPPYPGAYSATPAGHLVIEHGYWRDERSSIMQRPALLIDGDRIIARCGDSGLITILAASIDGRPLTLERLRDHGTEIPLTSEATK